MMADDRAIVSDAVSGRRLETTAMKQRDRSRSKKRPKKRHTRSSQRRVCCWCKKEVPDSEAWTGDISGAIAFSNVSRSTARKGLALCLSCGSDGLSEIIRELNDKNPELKLIPMPSMFVMRDQPIPNLGVCLDFFSRCERACRTGSPKELANLLLQFCAEHPTEWWYSGWKDNYVAWLVMGQAGGTFQEKKETARYWSDEYWKGVRDHEESDKRGRARWAALELNTLRPRSSQAPKSTPASSLGGEQFLKSASDAFLSGLHRVNPPGCSPPAMYDAYAQFILWLGKNWYRLSSKKHSRPLYELAAETFLKERPASKVECHELVELARGYDECDGVQSGDDVPLISQVLLRFVANRHGVSSSQVAHIRAELNKQNARR